MISSLIIVSILGATNGFLLSGPRVYYAMAKDGFFFSQFSNLDSRFHTPVFSLLAQGFWSVALTLIGSFQNLFAYVIFTAWVFYGLAVGGVIVLRYEQPAVERPYHVPAYLWLPVIFILAAGGLTISTIHHDPEHAALGIGMILLGLPMYALFWRIRSSKSERACRQE